MMDDPFTKIRRLSDARENADWEWRTEVMNLRAAGFSTRAIAQVAGVSHDTVWRCR
jgi:DNA-binding NarL/FixJ family response regulator